MKDEEYVGVSLTPAVYESLEENFYITTYTNSTPEIRMDIKHNPSGLFVTGRGSTHFVLKSSLIKELKTLISARI